MYKDLNPSRGLFGGRLMEWIDVAAAMYAKVQLDAGRLVTLKVSELLFKSPAYLGDFVEIYCGAIKFGTTSLTIGVDVINRNSHQLLVSCEIVMVNVTDDGRPLAHGRTQPKPLEAIVLEEVEQ